MRLYILAFSFVWLIWAFPAQAIEIPHCQERYSFLLDGGKPIRRTYLAGDKNPISFGYELEFHPEENPKLLEYYKPIGYSDEDWRKLSPAQRLEKAKEAWASANFKTDVLEATAQAPEFLARRAIKEAGGRVELEANDVSEDLHQTFSQLEWVWANIGPGSLHGHAAFGRKNIRGAANFVKLDFDAKQAEALQRSYESYLEKGTEPAKNLSHHSLGPLDRRAFDWLAKQTKKKKPAKTKYINKNSKYTYAIAYRPDLYGPKKIGFEVRNCHKRLDCLKHSLVDLAEEISRGFSTTRDLANAGPLLDPRHAKKLSPEARAMLAKVEPILRARTGGQYGVAGPKAKSRFLLPLLDWRAHPYIGALDNRAQAEFLERAGKATEEFEASLGAMAEGGLAGDELLRALQMANAKWAHDARLSQAFAEGKKKFLDIRGLLPVPRAALGPPEVAVLKSLLPDVNNSLEDAIRALVIKGGDGSSGYHELVSILKKASPRERAVLAENLRSDPDYPNYLANIWRLGNRELYQGIAFSKHAGAAARTLFSQTGPERDYLMRATSALGLRTTETNPLGGNLRLMLGKADADKLAHSIRAARSAGIPPGQFAYFLADKDFLTSSYATDSGAMKNLSRILFSPEPGQDSGEWLIREINGKWKSGSHALRLEALTRLADRFETLDDSHTFVSLQGRDYIFEGGWAKTRIRPASDFSPKKIDKWREAGKKLKGTVSLGPFEASEIARDNSAVYIASYNFGGINHQRLIMGGKIYSMGHAGLYVKTVTPGEIANSRVARIKVEPQILAELRSVVNDRVGMPVEWKIKNPSGSEVNCTNWISCDLEKTGALEFPNQYTRADAKGQMEWLKKAVGENPSVEKVFENRRYARRGLEVRLGVWLLTGLLASPLLPIAIDKFSRLNEARNYAEAELIWDADLLQSVLTNLERGLATPGDLDKSYIYLCTEIRYLRRQHGLSKRRLRKLASQAENPRLVDEVVEAIFAQPDTAMEFPPLPPTLKRSLDAYKRLEIEMFSPVPTNPYLPMPYDGRAVNKAVDRAPRQGELKPSPGKGAFSALPLPSP
jgi:hypothetical protein